MKTGERWARCKESGGSSGRRALWGERRAHAKAQRSGQIWHAPAVERVGFRLFLLRRSAAQNPHSELISTHSTMFSIQVKWVTKTSEACPLSPWTTLPPFRQTALVPLLPELCRLCSYLHWSAFCLNPQSLASFKPLPSPPISSKISPFQALSHPLYLSLLHLSSAEKLRNDDSAQSLSSSL